MTTPSPVFPPAGLTTLMKILTPSFLRSGSYDQKFANTVSLFFLQRDFEAVPRVVSNMMSSTLDMNSDKRVLKPALKPLNSCQINCA